MLLIAHLHHRSRGSSTCSPFSQAGAALLAEDGYSHSIHLALGVFRSPQKGVRP